MLDDFFQNPEDPWDWYIYTCMKTINLTQIIGKYMSILPMDFY